MTVTVHCGSESLEIGCHPERMTLGLSEIREEHRQPTTLFKQL
jgi:hypothetical protein